jgi:hypothetical protein
MIALPQNETKKYNTIGRMNEYKNAKTNSLKVHYLQGDQIGRIFAYWEIVFFGWLYENGKGSPNFGATSSHRTYLLCIKCVGLNFGGFFHKFIWSP